MGDFLDGGGFGGALGGGFGDLLGAEALALVYALASILVAVANFIWAVLVAVANFLYNLLRTVGDFLINIFVHHVLPVLRTIVNDYLRLKAWLARVFAPIIRLIQRVRTWYTIHILPIQLLIIDIIQRIRIALEILRLLHVQWAAKLDQDLALIQGYLTRSIVDVLATLNQITTILQIAVDPSMILRKDFYTASNFASLIGLGRAVGALHARPIFPDEKAQEDGNKGLMNPATPPVTPGPGNTVTFSPAFSDMVTKMNAAVPIYNSTVAQ